MLPIILLLNALAFKKIKKNLKEGKEFGLTEKEIIINEINTVGLEKWQQKKGYWESRTIQFDCEDYCFTSKEPEDIDILRAMVQKAHSIYCFNGKSGPAYEDEIHLATYYMFGLGEDAVNELFFIHQIVPKEVGLDLCYPEQSLDFLHSGITRKSKNRPKRTNPIFQRI